MEFHVFKVDIVAEIQSEFCEHFQEETEAVSKILKWDPNCFVCN